MGAIMISKEINKTNTCLSLHKEIQEKKMERKWLNDAQEGGGLDESGGRWCVMVHLLLHHFMWLRLWK